MIRKLKQKYGINSLKVGGMWLLTVVSLGCAFLLISGRGPSMCIGLKPYNNLDELLFQFYANLDSECLFKMPVTELEKKWDTKILSEERAASGYKYFQLSESSDFQGKSYRSERDAFYIEKKVAEDAVEFYIKITNNYNKKYGTLFPDNEFPRSLPVPLKKYYHTEVFSSRLPPDVSEWDDSYSSIISDPTEIAKILAAQENTLGEIPPEIPTIVMADEKKLNYYHIYSYHTYYWLNRNKSRVIYTNVPNSPVTEITITNKVQAQFRN